MNYKKHLPVFIVLFFTCLSVFAQRDTLSLQTIADRSVKYTNNYPIEKVYVHFDKPYYAAGDTVWLKAYATVDIHQPTQMSKIVYVDVYNDQDSMMVSLKLPLVNGVAPGMFAISPRGWRQGNYRLRAYTMWMLNFDAAYLFTKVLTVGNPIDNDVRTNVSFSTIPGAQPSSSIKILYKDAKGLPYADKKVSWRVELSHDETAKGKGTTDANGYLTINLPPMPPINLTASTLFTVLDMGSRSVTSTFSLKSAGPSKDVQFFPEGGQMIVGVPGKVAFKAINAGDGLGVDLKGTVVDNAGQTVTTFTSRHLGMGFFTMTPETGKSYKANVNFTDGTSASYDLPRAQGSGITVTVTKNNADSLNLRIFANDAYLQANQNKKFYIIAQQGGFIKYAAQTTMQKLVYSQAIPKTKFQSGTLQITLFGPNGYPVAERMAFIQRNDLLNLSLASDKPLYNRRQPVKLTIGAKNGNIPVEANLSIAVIDESKVHTDEDAENTIFSSLLLTSDLRGYIEKPGYYFNHNDENTATDLDVLMMTQGYRRFVYRDVLTGKVPKIIAMPESGISISGTLRNNTGLPIFKGNVRLQTPNNNFAGQTTTNADGQYRFENVMLFDSTQVVINARDNLNANSLMLTYDGSSSPTVTRINTLPDERLNIDTTMRAYLDNSKRVYDNTHQLKEVVIKAVTPRRLGHLEHGALTGLNPEPDHFIDAERFKGCSNFITCFAGMVPGITYVENTLYVTRDYNAGIKKPMEVYLDGLQVDMPFLQSFDANEVESVEVFFKDGVSGINQRDGTDGVLVINKKKAPKGTKVSLAELQSLLPPPYLAKVTPRGYSATREFYSPKYEVGKPNGIGVDLRSTIYWNPKVITDKTTGSTTLQFYNADGTGSYRAVVEGIDKDGNIGHFVYRYKVQ